MTTMHMWNRPQHPAFRILALLFVLLAGMVFAGEARGRQKAKGKPVNVPTAEMQPSDWRYSFRRPPGDWVKPEFDDSKWKQGKSGFGTNCPGSITKTQWNSSDIWLRREFQLAEAAPKDVKLRLHHDEDAEV